MSNASDFLHNLVNPLITIEKTGDFYAARILPMGLTGYGDSEEAAIVKVKRMFGAATIAFFKTFPKKDE
jgi:hypothetical protein